MSRKDYNNPNLIEIQMKNILKILLILCILACKKDSSTNSTNTPVVAGNDPNFKIVVNQDKGFSHFNRKVVVFGIDIYAVAAVEDAKLLHAANVMAQYLDNDEDGNVDDPNVMAKMKEKKAYLVMWKKSSDLTDPPSGREGQDLGNDETNPSYVSGGLKGRFDAALEEVLHIINNAGHSYAYPEVFGQNENSALVKAMDIARGGKFKTIPSSYPSAAWYTYNDATCAYLTCQSIEYMYWALTSILGGQKGEGRLSEISNEWKLNTEELVKQRDKAIYSILTNPKYKLPKTLPNGRYRR